MVVQEWLSSLWVPQEPYIYTVSPRFEPSSVNSGKNHLIDKEEKLKKKKNCITTYKKITHNYDYLSVYWYTEISISVKFYFFNSFLHSHIILPFFFILVLYFFFFFASHFFFFFFGILVERSEKVLQAFWPCVQRICEIA